MADSAPAPTLRRRRLAVAAAAVLLAIIVALVWLLWPQPRWLQGQIEVTQTRVASKIPGRIERVDVALGQTVKAGDLLATLATPDLQAKAQQADALIAAASAQADKAHAGARTEQIAAARAQWQAAEQQARLAQTTAGRVERLYAQGVMTGQKRDEARATAVAARAQADAARQSLRMAEHATRPEDLRAAQAQLAQARGGRAEVQAALEEQDVRASVDGEISARNVEPGEVVGAGAPLFAIAQLRDPWLTLNVREDLLAGVRIGSELPVRIPALGDRAETFRVTYMAPLADFATWRSTRDLGGFDLRTFELRAKPVAAIEGLRPGMSVLISERALQHAEP